MELESSTPRLRPDLGALVRDGMVVVRSEERLYEHADYIRRG